MIRKPLLAGVLVIALAALVAGCGGDGDKQGYAQTKAEYAAALDAICNDGNAKLDELGLSDLASFKEKGDEAVSIAEDTVQRFRDLTPPDEVKDAADRFDESSEQILQDLKDARDAANDNDAEAYREALEHAQEHGRTNDAAANEIGAQDCAG